MPNPIADSKGINPLAASRLKTTMSKRALAQVTRMIWGSKICKSALLKGMGLMQSQACGLENGQQLFHSGMHQRKEGFGVQTDPEDKDDQGNNYC